MLLACVQQGTASGRCGDKSPGVRGLNLTVRVGGGSRGHACLFVATLVVEQQCSCLPDVSLSRREHVADHILTLMATPASYDELLASATEVKHMVSRERSRQQQVQLVQI